MDEIKKIQHNNNSKHRNGEIDFLRFVFAIIIVLHHSRYILGDDRSVFLGGSLGVEFFFLVSGYLLMASVQKDAKKKETIKTANTTNTESTVNTVKTTSTVNTTNTENKVKTVKTAKKQSLGSETFCFIMRKISAFLPEWLIGWTIGFVFVILTDNVRGHEIFERFRDYFWELTLLRSTGLYVSAINGVMWYITAMLICMAILYPLLRRYPDGMSKVVCPLAGLLILGFMMRNYGMLRDPHKWLGFTYKGNVRAMAELCLGVFMYRVVMVIRKRSYTKVFRTIVMIAEVALYAQVIWFMYTEKPCEDDFYYLFLLFAAVMLSFSGTGLLEKIFDNRLTAFLARYSTALFFAHIYFAQHLNNVLPKAMGDRESFIAYLALSFSNGLIVMGLSDLYRKNKAGIKRAIRHICIEE